jgi:sugar phosphate isomerase/epimerase
MKLSFSNIAWTPEENTAALEILTQHGIRHIEAAPGRLWNNLDEATVLDAAETRQGLEIQKFSISGFQAILFGRAELLLFNPEKIQELSSYLCHLAALCGGVGGSYLVFGAPKNRWVPEGMHPQEAFEIAVSFFQELGSEAVKQGVAFGIEANPVDYGCNFCTTVEEVARLVRAVNSQGVRWHLDTGEMAMNKELLPDTISANIDLVGSIHISEPLLGGFESPWSGHAAVAECIKDHGYSGVVSIEMKRQVSGLEAVKTAIDFVQKTYF